MEIELPEACKICLANANNHDIGEFSGKRPYWSESGFFNPCMDTVNNGGSSCLPKDRTMIVLLDKLLKK